jgi:hypothetical protein
MQQFRRGVPVVLAVGWMMATLAACASDVPVATRSPEKADALPASPKVAPTSEEILTLLERADPRVARHVRADINRLGEGVVLGNDPAPASTMEEGIDPVGSEFDAAIGVSGIDVLADMRAPWTGTTVVTEGRASLTAATGEAWSELVAPWQSDPKTCFLQQSCISKGTLYMNCYDWPSDVAHVRTTHRVTWKIKVREPWTTGNAKACPKRTVASVYINGPSSLWAGLA